MFRTGYIIDRRGDLIWFLGLPLFALCFALISQYALSAVAVLSIGLWIEYPHHFATFLRTYGLSDDWRRFRERLIVGPIIILSMTCLGLIYAPLSVALLSLMWNQQHFVMQLHGFTRIYDFKAKTGDASIGGWDFALNWVLYVNMFLASPLFTRLWARQLQKFDVIVTPETVDFVHVVSWSVFAGYLIAYGIHVVYALKSGNAVNPIKYLYIGLTYTVLYIVAWHTASVLVHAVANMIIHGIQYNVIVYWYLRRKVEQEGRKPSWVASLVRPGNTLAFVAIGVLYAVIYQVVRGRPLDEFSFGLFSFMTYSSKPLEISDQLMGSELVMVALLLLPGTLHLYFDSFIWKVRDKHVQGGL